MRLACFILLIGIGNFINAQPVLQRSNIASVGYEAILRHVINGNITPGTGGANMTWDFSMDTSLTPIDSDLFDLVVDPSTTPFAAQFPTANYALEENQDARMQYLFADVTATAFEDTADNVVSSSSLNEYPVTRDEFLLPFHYLDTLKGNYTEINISTTNDTLQYTDSVVYNAYGTLITPFGTYDSVVLIENITNGVKTYTWWSSNPVFPLLVSESSDTTFYVPVLSTGIPLQTNTVQNLSLYPDPSAGNCTLTFSLADPAPVNICLYDVSGRKMKEIFYTNLSAGMNHVSMDDHTLASGVYFLAITANGQSERIKYIKL